MRTHLGAAATLAPAEITPEDFQGYGHAHVEGYLLFNPDLMRGVLHAAKQAGCRISVDLASFEVVQASREVLPELLEAYVDIVFANEEEATAFAGTKDPAQCLDALHAHCATVAVKLGAQGVLLRTAAEPAPCRPCLLPRPWIRPGPATYGPPVFSTACSKVASWPIAVAWARP